ncbi:hypothetical protein ABPG75_010125 [Micractinium tetrahymenae]
MSFLRAALQYALTIGSFGSAVGQFNGVSGILPLPNGLLLVADKGNHRIQFVQDDGSVVRVLGNGTAGAGPDDWNRPSDAALSPDGKTLFVIDSFNQRIKVFTLDPNGNGVLEPGEPALNFIFGSPGNASGQFILPLSVVTGADGAYITDFHLSRVTKFSFAGNVLWTIGSFRSANSQFILPVGCAVGRNVQVGSTLFPEVVYVSDYAKKRVQYFNASNGSYLGQFGSAEGQLFGPGYIDVAADGGVMVADVLNQRFQRLGPTGELQYIFGTQGDGPGRFQDPSGIAVVSFPGYEVVYVADDRRNVIQKFQLTL